MRVYEKSWYGLPAVVLENSRVRVTFVPSLGAKIAELTYLPTEFEWLVAPQRSLSPVSYGAVFTQQDMSGWDDVCPTIDACTVTLADGQTVVLPDHGEVWTMPWQIDTLGEARLTMQTTGTALPYTLRRHVSLDDLRVILDYTLTNTGTQALPWLWAAHPQFVSTPTMRIVLPSHVTAVTNAYPRPFMGDHGVRHTWPLTQRLNDGQWLALDRQFTGAADCHKVYVAPETPIDAAMLHETRTGETLRFAWTDPVDYLGLLVDTGYFNSQPIIALEPATAYYDDLSRACALGCAPSLRAGETASWRITLTLGKD